MLRSSPGSGWRGVGAFHGKGNPPLHVITGIGCVRIETDAGFIVTDVPAVVIKAAVTLIQATGIGTDVKRLEWLLDRAEAIAVQIPFRCELRVRRSGREQQSNAAQNRCNEESCHGHLHVAVTARQSAVSGGRGRRETGWLTSTSWQCRRGWTRGERTGLPGKHLGRGRTT